MTSEETRLAHERNLRTTVEALARAVDTRNGYTHLHSQAVAYYATGLAKNLGFTERRVEMLRTAAVLHDVGKISVPDAVLWKPTPLTPEERALISGHSDLGYRILSGLGVPEIRSGSSTCTSATTAGAIPGSWRARKYHSRAASSRSRTRSTR